MTNIYVLKCKRNKYYVGKTTDVDRRFAEHLDGNHGSVWTARYVPQEVIEVTAMMSDSDEMNTTLKYMKKFGIDNVRGAQWSNVNLTSQQLKAIELAMNPNACFICGLNGHFAKDCSQRTQIRRPSSPGGFFRLQEVNDYADGYLQNRTSRYCQRCGRYTHNKSDCYAYRDVNGEILGCARCGRDSHSTDDCYATFDSKRRRLN